MRNKNTTFEYISWEKFTELVVNRIHKDDISPVDLRRYCPDLMESWTRACTLNMLTDSPLLREMGARFLGILNFYSCTLMMLIVAEYANMMADWLLKGTITILDSHEAWDFIREMNRHNQELALNLTTHLAERRLYFRDQVGMKIKDVDRIMEHMQTYKCHINEYLTREAWQLINSREVHKLS